MFKAKVFCGKVKPIPNSQIVSSLRSKLSDLGYSTRCCVICEWVDHEDDMTLQCSGCGEYLCEDCNTFASVPTKEQYRGNVYCGKDCWTREEEESEMSE